MNVIRTAALAVAAVLFCAALTSCGGGGDSPIADSASCRIERSDLGPFAPDTPLGQSMDEDEARARMARDGIESWVAVTATGPWQTAWDTATNRLGGGIHTGLTWIDVDGEISGLFEAGDAYAFTDLRVSRSFQGKIEHSDAPVFLPLQVDGKPANFDAGCTITALEVGDEINEVMTDVLDEVPVAG